MNTILGLDLSLTGAGVVVRRGDEVVHRQLLSTAPEDGPRHSRITYIACEIAAVCREHEPDLAAMEGYAFGKQFNSEPLIELGGVVKHYLFHEEVPWCSYPPQSLKKFVLGGVPPKRKGESRGDHNKRVKEMMVQAARDLGCRTYDDNVADAFHMARWGDANFRHLISGSLETVG